MKQTYNLKPASAILTAIFLLFGIFVVSMIGIQIVMNGLVARRAQGASSKAFYAAESGVEKALSLYNLYGVQKYLNKDIMIDSNCSSYPKIDFTMSGGKFCAEDTTENNHTFYMSGIGDSSDIQAVYWVKQQRDIINPRYVSLNARGKFTNTTRELYVSFCLPECEGVPPGGNDGCGRACN